MLEALKNRFKVVTLGTAAILLAGFAVIQFVRASVAQSDIEQNADYHAQIQEQRAQAALQNCTEAHPVAEIAQCEGQARNSYETAKHDIDDLQAQQIAALWNGVIGETALVGMFVGILGVVLVAFTFRETRKSNEIAKSTAHRELRAYVTPAGLNLEPFMKDGSRFWDIQQQWENAGTTPALSVSTNINRQDFEGSVPDDFPYPDQQETGVHDPCPIGPSQKVGSRSPAVTEQIIRDVRHGNRKLLIWGWAEYQDIFEPGKWRRTEFCYQLAILAKDGSQSFAFLPYGRHNGVDETCMKQPTRDEED